MAAPLMKYNPAFLDDETLMRTFVARTSELERILEVLRENTAGSNQHLLIIGPRGIGKTTLVLRTAAEIHAEPNLGSLWYPVVFGEETYEVSSAGEFWLEALFHVGQQTGEERWRKAHEELLGERDEERLRRRALAQLMDFADQEGKRLTLVVENLNMLFGGQISDNDAWVLRHTLMNEPRLMLIGTATSRFREMEEYNQALYELFRIIELEPLADTEARALWTAATGQDAPAHQMRPLQILTGGNPRLIRILSEFAAKTSFRSLMEDLTRLVDEHTEYFKHHLDNLPPQERKVFVVLADLWDPSTARQVADAARLSVNAASAQLKRLMERGAVTAPYRQGRVQFYQVAERMYNIYHLMRRRGQVSSRVQAVVRFMVSLYRDEELVRTTRSLVEEAARLAADQRREHFIAYEAILMREPRLAGQLVEATRLAFEAMPDAPASLRRLIGLDGALEAHSESQVEIAEGEALLDLHVDQVEDVKTLLQLANQLSTQSDRLEEAEAAFRKALRKDPDNAQTWHRLGFFLMKEFRRFDESLEAFGRALALDPGDAGAWQGKSVALLALGHFEEALESIDRALALNADNAVAWEGRAATLLNLERFEEALESYDRALALNGVNAVAWLGRGAALMTLERAEEALESYDRALALNGVNAVAWLGRGGALLTLERAEEALESYDRALALNGGNAAAWYGKGAALGRVGRTEEALESYDRALTLDADNIVAWLSRGGTLITLGRTAEALESFDRALALDPTYAAAWHGKGAALGQVGRTEEALESIDRSLALNADDSMAWHDRGAALLDLGRTEEALESFNRVLTLQPESELTLIARGIAHRAMGRFHEAEGDFRHAISLGVEELSASMILVELLLVDLQRPDEAIQVARESIERTGGSADALDAMAWMFFEDGRGEDLREAEDWSRRAVEQVPGSGFYRHTLACLLGAQGKWEDALRHAAIFLQDREFLDEYLEDVIDFFIDIVAAGYGKESLDVIQASGTGETLEPLVIAIRRLAGEQVDVAREILEVSTDVIKRIEERRPLHRGT